MECADRPRGRGAEHWRAICPGWRQWKHLACVGDGGRSGELGDVGVEVVVTRLREVARVLFDVMDGAGVEGERRSADVM